MQTSWQLINPTNNTFFWYNYSSEEGAANEYYKITIPPSSPSNRSTFETILEECVQKVLNDATVSIESSTMQVQINPGDAILGTAGQVSTEGYFVFFANRKNNDNNPDRTTINVLDYNSDSYELMGAYPTQDGANPVSGALAADGTPAAGQNTHYFPIRCNMHTLESLYLKTGIESTNMQSDDFAFDIPNTDIVTPSQIFARIPVEANANSEKFGDNIHIQYLHSADTYSMYPNTRAFDRINFTLQDEKGRPMWAYREDVAKHPMEFSVVLRVDVCELEPSASDETTAILGAHDKERCEREVGRKKSRVGSGF